ncbi:TetR/AcrR family transcriptional regulator [Sciscionella marina]|uniref:TetR/AcrR family transcriptional regulator n=1 Tax=Sciscionella marina TaxID=508770 RepID=UPI000362FD2C|nr:TetR/AcrR family transcriptional regulator [Sciscionella marina]
MSGTQRRSDTRDRIQQVALELFTEQGYEGTSLREIAERLEVTKAAVYYHYRTKEEILGGAVEGAIGALDEVISWARQVRMDSENRRELVRRYAAALDERAVLLTRFIQGNQPVLRELKSLEGYRERVKELFELLAARDAPLAEQLRCRLALISINLGKLAFADLELDEREVNAAALDVALGLVVPRGETGSEDVG